jgi:hypothetical protein
MRTRTRGALRQLRTNKPRRTRQDGMNKRRSDVDTAMRTLLGACECICFRLFNVLPSPTLKPSAAAGAAPRARAHCNALCGAAPRACRCGATLSRPLRPAPPPTAPAPPASTRGGSAQSRPAPGTAQTSERAERACASARTRAYVAIAGAFSMAHPLARALLALGPDSQLLQTRASEVTQRACQRVVRRTLMRACAL